MNGLRAVQRCVLDGFDAGIFYRHPHWLYKGLVIASRCMGLFQSRLLVRLNRDSFRSSILRVMSISTSRMVGLLLTRSPVP